MDRTGGRASSLRFSQGHLFWLPVHSPALMGISALEEEEQKVGARDETSGIKKIIMKEKNLYDWQKIPSC